MENENKQDVVILVVDGRVEVVHADSNVNVVIFNYDEFELADYEEKVLMAYDLHNNKDIVSKMPLWINSITQFAIEEYEEKLQAQAKDDVDIQSTRFMDNVRNIMNNSDLI